MSAATALAMSAPEFRAAGTDLSIEPKVRPTAAQWAAIDTALGSLKSRTLVNSFDPLDPTARQKLRKQLGRPGGVIPKTKVKNER